jgi:glutamate-1-semialdehyde 2,1-aminomutase
VGQDIIDRDDAGHAVVRVQNRDGDQVVFCQCFEHVFRLGERARTGLTELYARLGVPAVVSGFGSVFVTYFLDGPVVSYDDLLRNDVDLFVGYRRELMKDGIFELPLNLKRSHFSYAHTDEDVDRLLVATEAAVTRYLETRA